MSFKVGDTDVANVYVGDAPAAAVYVGDVKVWPTAPAAGVVVGSWEWHGSGNLNTLAGTFGQAGTNGSNAFGFNNRDATGATKDETVDYPIGSYTFGGVAFTTTGAAIHQSSGPSGNGYARYNDGGNITGAAAVIADMLATLTVGQTYDLIRQP